MKRLGWLISVVVLTGAGFGGGVWFARQAALKAGAEKPSEPKPLYWVDPMHPSYKSDRPGIAPDCGMELVPIFDEEGTGKGAARKDEVPSNVLQISPEMQQRMGVTFATASYSSTQETLAAAGRVVLDETKITRIHPKLEGWISSVNVDFIGQVVKAGDPLLTLYSPEMLASEQEFILALKGRDTVLASANEEARANAARMVEAARRRLSLWDLKPDQLEQVERTRTPIRSITVSAASSGVVIARNAFANQKVGPETELYALADLGTAWVMGEVFEAEVGKIAVGQAATVRLANAAGRSFPARVNFIQPQVDPATRTVKVRLEVANPDLQLKPEMFVNVEFRMAAMKRLMVPADAVMNTGKRQTAFVDIGEGRLEARAVETGERSGNLVQILSGLRDGEKVVASGTFLIDSEAQLKNALPMAGDHAHD